MGLSQRVTRLLEAWLGEGENIAQTRPWVDSLPTPSTNMSSTATLVTVGTSVGGTTIVSANSNRRKLTLRNNGTVPVLIKVNGIPTILDYNDTIAKSSSIRAGDGGVWGTETIKLEIKGLTETGSTVISVTEEEIT